MTPPVEYSTESSHTGSRLRILRQRCGLSMRQLAEQAQVAVSYVSGVEAGRISPTIATLHKLLVVLGTDMGTFFAEKPIVPGGSVFRRETMQTIIDTKRCYTLLLPKRADIKIGMMDEELRPGEKPEFETLSSDLAGYIIKGELYLEIEGEEPQLLRGGDAFYVAAGRPCRGHAHNDKPVRLVTVTSSPRY